MTVLLAIALLLADVPLTDREVWNEGVSYYEAGDATNALRVLRPLMLSKTHGARAAEVVAKLEYEKGNQEAAAEAAQIALRAAPSDAKANRNFTRATSGLPARREKEHIDAVLKAAEGQDPGALLLTATKNARRLFAESATYRTNEASRAVARADRLAADAATLADAWIPVRQAITQSVTNEEQAATILMQIEQAESKTKDAARALGDLDESAYAILSDVEHDLTRFLKLAILPPPAMDEDLVAQSNAWLDVEKVNGRNWQQDALDFTRAFRAKFPAWAKAYEQQAQSDTNKPPFTAEDQAKVSALSTELEKIQISCVEKVVAADQEKALRLIDEIRALLPKNPNGGGGSNQQPNEGAQNPNQSPQNNDSQNQPQPNETDEKQTEDPNEQKGEEDEKEAGETAEEPPDEQVEDVLKKAQERNDEHEADKKARMRKAPLPPNERDW